MIFMRRLMIAFFLAGLPDAGRFDEACEFRSLQPSACPSCNRRLRRDSFPVRYEPEHDVPADAASNRPGQPLNADLA
jgi:hypothetical protein